MSRLLRSVSLWRCSTVSKLSMPVVVASFVWAFMVAYFLPILAPGVAARAAQMWIPLSLQGNAIGLLLVFRTNNAYRRLDEGREQWGEILCL